MLEKLSSVDTTQNKNKLNIGNAGPHDLDEIECNIDDDLDNEHSSNEIGNESSNKHLESKKLLVMPL